MVGQNHMIVVAPISVLETQNTICKYVKPTAKLTSQRGNVLGTQLVKLAK